MVDRESASGLEPIARRVLPDIDFERPALKDEIEPDAMEHVRERRPEAELSVVIAQSGKSVDENHPDASHGGDVTSVFDVPRDITQVHERRHAGVLEGFVHLADFSRHDALDAG